MVEIVTETDKINIFKEWLVANGAKFLKIEWPRLDTTGGVRGAVATDFIATNEPMVEIPAHLMMSPPVAFASDIGVYLRQNKDILKSDLLLTIFIMSERSKGSESFFHPFLQILPQPGTIASWLDEDLLHLQVYQNYDILFLSIISDDVGYVVFKDTRVSFIDTF